MNVIAICSGVPRKGHQKRRILSSGWPMYRCQSISKTAIASARVSSLDWVRVPSDVNWPSQGTVHDQKKKEKKLLMSGEPHLCG